MVLIVFFPQEITVFEHEPFHLPHEMGWNASIEKYLKARILEAGFEVPRTHDLPVLLDVVLPAEPLWESARPRLETLTSYAVVFRYPGDSATRALAKTAIADARWVRSIIRSAFRLR